MKVTRRQFLQTIAASAAALGLNQLQVSKLAEVLATENGGVSVIWLQGQNCTGCTTSFAGLEWDAELDSPLPADVRKYLNANDVEPGPGFANLHWPSTLHTLGLNSAYWDNAVTTLDDVALDIISLEYNQTIMATAGEAAYDLLQGWMVHNTGWDSGDGAYRVLIVEGSIPETDDKFCTIGAALQPDVNGEPVELSVASAVTAIAHNASLVLAVGTCAAFGGIPAANSDTTDGRMRTGAVDVKTWIDHSILVPGDRPPVVNVPGCPPNPDWILGTIVHYLVDSFHLDLEGTPTNLDSQGRPKFFYGKTNHGGRCPRYQAYCDGMFATFPGEAPADNGRHFTEGLPSTGTATGRELGADYNIPLCLLKLGCKGYSTGADCANGGPGEALVGGAKGRGWNRAHDASDDLICRNSCINNGHPCMGCTEKGYPDKYSPFLTFTTTS